MHVNGPETCKGCELKLNGCDPRIVNFLDRIRVAFPDCHVAVGYRDQQDQALAYDHGLSKLQWPDSKHNCCDLAGNPESLAIDLFRLLENGQAGFSIDYYQEIWKWTQKQTDLIEHFVWGGEWLHFKDWDHFEVKT